MILNFFFFLYDHYPPIFSLNCTKDCTIEFQGSYATVGKNAQTLARVGM